MENKDVRVCWGTPDTVYYIDGKGETHGIDLSPYGYAFGIWDGVCITSCDRDETYGLMHDDLVEYYIMNNGWPSRDIVPPYEGYGNDYDFEELKKMPVRYEDDEYGTKDVKQVLYSYDEEYDEYSLKVTWGDGTVEDFEGQDEYQIRNDCYFPENVADDIIYHDGKEIENGYYLLQYDVKKRETYEKLISELYSSGIKLRGRILMDFESNYRNPNSFIAFWDNDEITPENIKILAKTWGSDVYNYILVTETNEQSATRYGLYNMPTLREYLEGKTQIKASSDTSEREKLYNIHLGKPEDKRAYFDNFLKNRENLHKNKLGKVTMAQYHNILYGENWDKEGQVLNESKMEKLPDNKYQHFINEFGTSKQFLLSHFLRDTKFDKTDYMPMSKGQINYVRWHRLLDTDTGQYRTIMRNPSQPIVNFYYLNDLIHLFLYAGSGNDAEEDATYGHYDYKNGILRYKISYKNQLKRNPDGTYYDGNGHLHRIKGTGDINVSSTKSTKGIYSPMSGIHQKQYKFGNRFDQYFQPEATIYNAQGKAVGNTRIKANDQIQHYLFPVSDIHDEDKLEQDVRTLISSIYSNFNGNCEESQKSYALFLAFLLGEYNNRFHGFDIWKKCAPRCVNLWRSILVSDAEKIIDEFEREYQEKLNSMPRKNAITYSPHELRDPEPINSTPLQAKNVRAWLNQMDESQRRKEIFISENQLKGLIGEAFKSREFIPKVRGGWTEKKILRYLKERSSASGLKQAIEEIASFKDVNEFANHLFWHGSMYSHDKLSPSITRSVRDAERYGGGGYGDRYYGISLTNVKKTATRFAYLTERPSVHLVVVKQDAVIKDMSGQITDSLDVNDIIVDLYSEGVDGVWIGGGEGELVIINPYAIINVKEVIQSYDMRYGRDDSNPSYDNPTTDELQGVLDMCKEYVQFAQGKRMPEIPKEPSERFKGEDWYNYDEKLARYQQYQVNPSEIDNARKPFLDRRNQIINALKFNHKQQ